MEMRLLHYSAEPFRFDPEMRYGEDTHKPCGLWLSVEGADDWPNWCKSEDFGLERLAHVSEVTLRKDANVLLIDTTAKLDDFNRRFGRGDCDSSHDIFWGEVKSIYGGLIIAPYQWQRRLALMWYYTWDCASGVIWDLSVIRECVARLKERA